MITSIADTNFVVALANKADKWHTACNKVWRSEDTIALPQSVLAEVGYMFNRELGNRAMADFLRNLNETKYRIVPLETEDFARTADILDQYADSRIDFVDATIVAVAERLRVTRILTLDQRDFHIIRPKHAPHFEVLPQAQ
jgi:predicted nucleic acid-binding protein